MNKLKVILILTVGLFLAVKVTAQGYAVIAGKLQFGPPDANIKLVVMSNTSKGSASMEIDSVSIQQLDNRNFEFLVPVRDEVEYIALDLIEYRDYHEKGVQLSTFFVKPGDTIFIHADQDKKLKFSGNARTRLELNYELSGIGYPKRVFNTDPATYYNSFKQSYAKGLQLISDAEGSIDAEDLRLIELDYKSTSLGALYQVFDLFKFGYGYNEKYGDIGKKVYEDFLYKVEEEKQDESLGIRSLFYARYLLFKCLADARYDSVIRKVQVHPLEFLTTKYSAGELRDRILTSYYFRNRRGMNKRYLEARPYLHTAKYHKIWDHLAQYHLYGNKVDLKTRFINPKGEKVTLEDFKGKVMVIDMWFTGCASCVPVAQAMPKIEKAFEHRDDVVFISLSVDAKIESWLKSIDRGDEHGQKRGLFYISDQTDYLKIEDNPANSKFLKDFHPTRSYPYLLLFDKKGRVYDNDVPLPQVNQGRDLIAVIQGALSNGD